MLSLDKVQVKLKSMPGWRLEGNALKREFTFASFADSMIFVNELGQAADDANHYPSSIDIRGGQVIVSLVSPDGSLTEQDFELAAQAQKLEVTVLGG